MGISNQFERPMKTLNAFVLAASLAAAVITPAHSAAIRDEGLFTDNTLARNDDGSTGLISLGFSINFFGLTTGNAYVNNNGNITFNGPLGTFTPFGLLTSTTPIIAPFFADVDTRSSGSNVVQYGQDVIGGRNVFGVNWINVGYFPSAADRLNSFQLILTERADVGAGDFDFEFNYDTINWETGRASGGSGGLGGNSARAGWTNGGATDLELAGSGVNGAFLDGGANSLISGSLNSSVAGRYIFNVRNGVVVPPTNNVPEPGTLLLAAAALVAMGASRRRKS
jgi:hypothetical protein